MDKLIGTIFKNFELYQKARELGYDYIVNPETDELHSVESEFFGSHNLHLARLENFVGIKNIGRLGIHLFPDGTQVPIYDLESKKRIGTYTLNKCKHCFK